MISDVITKKIGEAMKAKDEIKLSTLRLLSSALNYEFIAKQHKLSEEEELAVVKREANKRKDTIETYEKLKDPKTPNPGIQQRIDQEKKELEILKEYLPAEMPDDELQKLVDDAMSETGATSISDMGKVIGNVMGKAQGKADGKKVAEKVKEALATRR
jgi:hypothetical protein